MNAKTPQTSGGSAFEFGFDLPIWGGCFMAVLSPWAAGANPAGLSVQSGTAGAVINGTQLTITASEHAFLNWQSFNIAPGETTRFLQPAPTSFVWNQIHDATPSQILGSLEANGNVVLINSAGFYFGPHAFVSAAGLIVSTAAVTPVESSAGLFWQFNGAPPQASIVNYGALHAGKAGSLFLIAERVENHGTLSAPEGNLSLLAAKEVLVSSRPDGRALSATVRLPSGSVDNSGRLLADAGSIALNAQVVNQNGLVQANSVRERNGVIELVASESIALGGLLKSLPGATAPAKATGGESSSNPRAPSRMTPRRESR
jgi:filamentous hemagglutinin family protein